jgi:peptidoglycan/LPS O-acetylase OafA/YrhL
MADQYPERGHAGSNAVATTRPGPWRQAQLRAGQTPPTRNRYVDLLRAASIVVVVLGHWLMAAPTAESGVRFTLSDMLHVAPWTQWLTWIFQVMPLFFVVGGYANAASWESARATGAAYGHWVSRRLQRLVRPVVPFVLVWCALALSGRWLGLGRTLVESGSRAAFVPTWFLAVYVLVIVLVPAMHAAWRRYGLASFWALVVAAAVVDTVARGSGIEGVRWVNYLFVWLAIHQLGFAWRDGAFGEPVRAASFALTGLAGLIILVGLASYPVSMVTVPGETAANSNPPTLALLALGVMHSGVLLALEGPARRLLGRRVALWTTTVFINGVIMTLYLWHATVMVLIVGLAELPGVVGLRFVPNTAAWWLTRLPWLVVLSIVLAAFVALFGRAEGGRPSPTAHPPAWRSVLGAVALCVGLVILGAAGIGGEHPLGVRPAPVLLTLGGALLVTGGIGLPRGTSHARGTGP